MSPKLKESKFLTWLKWGLTVLIPAIVALVISIFSYGVKAGDYIQTVENTSSLVNKVNEDLIKSKVDISDLKIKELYLDRTFQENLQTQKEFQAFILAASVQLSALNQNSINNFEMIQGEFNTLKEQVSKLQDKVFYGSE